jgi:hypothetical protein
MLITNVNCNRADLKMSSRFAMTFSSGVKITSDLQSLFCFRKSSGVNEFQKKKINNKYIYIYICVYIFEVKKDLSEECAFELYYVLEKYHDFRFLRRSNKQYKSFSWSLPVKNLIFTTWHRHDLFVFVRLYVVHVTCCMHDRTHLSLVPSPRKKK